MRAASGSQRVEKLLALTDAYLQAGNFEKAAEFASEASDFARKIGQADLQALALNREGKLLAATGKRGLFGKDKAPGKFKQSLQIIRSQRRPNKALALDNLQQLRQLAERAGRSSEVADIDAQIARLNDLTEPLPPPASPGVAPEKPLTQEVFQKEMSALYNQIHTSQSSQQVTAQQRVNYERQFAAMQAEQAAYKAQIDEMNENQAKTALAFMQQRFILDSLKNQTSIDALNVKNAELALSESENKRNFYLAAFFAMLLLAGGALYSYIRAKQSAKILSEKNKIIRSEQERSENLLLNILPALVADELKKQGRTSARYFEDVSVLFADFVGFSQIAEKLTPQQLVSELDTCFQAFDQIIAKHNLEKIKTIGDAYMAAGGLPNGGGSQLRDMVQAARDMQDWLHTWNLERAKQGQPLYEARIGIHRGPVVAGVVGSKKFAFDIWGDTVNIAARIEAAGEGGKINISGEVFKVIGGHIPCQYRGKIPAKNKGEIDMYFVEN
ncbi:MAG: hypothetical protein IT260_02095 [Saprospiraceae bacterium]|nr:hypothetical protein [Saprospiraceae bacterium]